MSVLSAPCPVVRPPAVSTCLASCGSDDSPQRDACRPCPPNEEAEASRARQRAGSAQTAQRSADQLCLTCASCILSHHPTSAWVGVAGARRQVLGAGGGEEGAGCPRSQIRCGPFLRPPFRVIGPCCARLEVSRPGEELFPLSRRAADGARSQVVCILWGMWVSLFSRPAGQPPGHHDFCRVHGRGDPAAEPRSSVPSLSSSPLPPSSLSCRRGRSGVCGTPVTGTRCHPPEQKLLQKSFPL